jgi:membrane protein
VTGLIKQVSGFLTHDVWRIRLRDQSRRRSLSIRVLRIVLLSLRGFEQDKCMLRASALTFYTMLSIVPVVAMLFGVAKGFGFQEALENRMLAMVGVQRTSETTALVVSPEATFISDMDSESAASPPAQENRLQVVGEESSGESIEFQREAVLRIIEFSNRVLDNTNGGLIAGIGIALLFWTVIKLLGNIERSFNDIWGIKKHRALTRRFSDYLSFMLVCPVLFLMSSSVTVVVASSIEALVERLSFLGPLADLLLLLIRLLPFVVIWALFMFMYLFMPNGRVRFLSGLLGGVVAGTLFVLMQVLYVKFQVGVSRQSAIYGSFAALPLFLLWLQTSWLVVLFGAEISFAHQNVDTYEFEPDCLNVSPALKRLIALGVVHECVRRFQSAEEPSSAEELAHALETPIRLVNQILFELVEANVLSEARRDDERAVAYQPAQDVEKLTVHGVLRLLDERGHRRVPHLQSGVMEDLQGRLRDLSEIAQQADANVRLRDI